MAVFLEGSPLRLRRLGNGLVAVVDSAGVEIPVQSLTLNEAVDEVVTVSITAYVGGWDDSRAAEA